MTGNRKGIISLNGIYDYGMMINNKPATDNYHGTNFSTMSRDDLSAFTTKATAEYKLTPSGAKIPVFNNLTYLSNDGTINTVITNENLGQYDDCVFFINIGYNTPLSHNNNIVGTPTNNNTSFSFYWMKNNDTGEGVHIEGHWTPTYNRIGHKVTLLETNSASVGDHWYNGVDYSSGSMVRLETVQGEGHAVRLVYTEFDPNSTSAK